MRSSATLDDVLTVKGTPPAYAALASAISAAGHTSAARPVGAMMIGISASRPSIDADRSQRDTSTSTRGTNSMASKSVQFRASVTALSAPPSMKSKTAFGSLRRACSRSPAIEYARATPNVCSDEAIRAHPAACVQYTASATAHCVACFGIHSRLHPGTSTCVGVQVEVLNG